MTEYVRCQAVPRYS